MKKTAFFIILILILVLCLASCSKYNQKKQEDLDRAIDLAFDQFRQTENKLVAYKKLDAGGYLMVGDETPNGAKHKDYCYLIMTAKNGEVQIEENVFLQDFAGIFFDNEGTYSVFITYEGNKGTDYLVYVNPNMNYGRTFETTPDKDYVPYDNLNTEPLIIQDKDYQGNCPVWIFDLSAESVDENYELHYGDYVLTGKDLMSGSWTPPSD